MDTFRTYLPQDRLRALSRGETLPEHTTGTALFADISGFTLLTDGLRRTLGSRRGAETLSNHLEAVYTALIAEVEHFGGSVLGFAGDAITCWFDEVLGKAAPRAITSALAMQKAMQAFSGIPLSDESTIALTLKVALATGPTRRFLVGDPGNGYFDVLAGATVTRTATAEHLAAGREILLDEATVRELGSGLVLREWREDEASGEQFAVIEHYSGVVSPVAFQPPPELTPETIRPWVLPEVYDRVQTGQPSFLTEFRPCTAMFVRFMGLDYDSDSAGKRLDIFIRQMQTIVAETGGTLLQLTIGDKGSYAHLNFGALSTHEDDPRRAVKTALHLLEAAATLGYLAPLQIGITQGVMRAGTFGGQTRRTYNVLGDDVNLAARLMTIATAGEILVSGHILKSVQNAFTFEPRPPLQIKGKVEPISVFAVAGERHQRAVRLQEPNYSLPMVGRVDELRAIEEILDLALNGKVQVIGIVAEAGLGKSRLVAEVIRSARKKGFVGYGGACQSDGIDTPYLAWKSIWQAFFDVDPAMPMRKLIRWLESEIEDRAPSRIAAIPLLAPLLDLRIPDNDYTNVLEPKTRQSVLHALLEDCLKAVAQEEPILIVLEDLHWIDTLSYDLIEQLAKALVSFPVCFVLAYRPPQSARLQEKQLEKLPHFTRVQLHELNKVEAEGAIHAKLAQLYPAYSGMVSALLVDKLLAIAQGNPFFLEELLNFLRDRGLDPHDPADIEKIELPDSLHTLILSRIDQLTENEKTTLRVASIVGRLFRAKWLTGYYPELGELAQVKAALDALDNLDITPLDSPEPELIYLFKHIVTHEVTYESLPFETRAKLHEQLALYLETAYPDAPPLETLAFHYGNSNNIEKQCEYFLKAGETAQKNFANDAALAYYGRALPILQDVADKINVHMQRGIVLELLGRWEDTEVDYRRALELAQQLTDKTLVARAQLAMGRLYDHRGDYDIALEWLAQASVGFSLLDDPKGLSQVLTATGLVFSRKGENEPASQALNEGLKLAREVGDIKGISGVLNNLGILATRKGDYPEGRRLFEESLEYARRGGDKVGIALALNNVGIVARFLGNYDEARLLYEESLVLRREVGDKRGISGSLGNLGNLALNQGDYPSARALYEESLALDREMGDKWGIAVALSNIGAVALAQKDYPAAQALFEEALGLSHEIGDKFITVVSFNSLGIVALGQGDHHAAKAFFEEGLALGKEMDDKSSIAYALLGLGLAGLAQSPPRETAGTRQYILESLNLRLEMGEQVPLTSSLIGMAGFALYTGELQRSAQILGAAEAAINSLNAEMEVEIRDFFAQTKMKIRERLGETKFQAAWEEGVKWSLEEAVSYTLVEYNT